MEQVYMYVQLNFCAMKYPVMFFDVDVKCFCLGRWYDVRYWAGHSYWVLTKGE